MDNKENDLKFFQEMTDKGNTIAIKNDKDLKEAKLLLEEIQKTGIDLKIKTQKLNKWLLIHQNENSVCLWLNNGGILILISLIWQINLILPLLCIVFGCTLKLIINFINFRKNDLGIEKMINPGNIIGILQDTILEYEKNNKDNKIINN